ncbi:MAG: hypothetical protein ABSH34_34195 [Verrucomicrobiota bacterium]
MTRVFGRMDGDFGGRQGEDEPAAPGIDRLEPEHIAQELAGGLRGWGEQDDVSAAYHLALLSDAARTRRV